MDKKNFAKKIFIIVLSAAAFRLFSPGYLMAQGGAKEIKWLRVGQLHQYILNVGAEYEMGRTDRPSEQQDGLRWPAQFMFQDNLIAKAMWIGTTNYFDRTLNKEVPYKVIAVGTRTYDAINEVMPYEFKMIGKYDHPNVIVDGNPATDNKLNDIVDEIDPYIIPDRIIINKLHTYIGIDVTRKVMAFSQQYNDNYHIYDYVFKNTGIVDLKGTVDQKTLTGVVFYFQYRYGSGAEAYQRGWAANDNINWGRNCVNQTIGIGPKKAGYDFRAQYSWYGPHSGSPVDDWGAPDWMNGIALGGIQYIGNVILHADKSTDDHNDDPDQPSTTYYIGSDTGPQKNNQFDTGLMTRKYEAMTAGHPPVTHADQVDGGFADTWGTDAGGFSHGQGFGPYTLKPGDSIHIVLAEGVSGIWRKKNLEVIKNWFDENAPYVNPDGSITNDRDEYKRLWVKTGEDSLMQTFRRAIACYNSDFKIPQPPPPPDMFEVKSGGNKITLTWSNNAELWPNFDGYRIYRAVGRPDTLYDKIFECSAADNVNSYDDTSAVRGFEYFYYIQTKDDGSTNNIEPGVPLVSSKFWTMTNVGAFLRRPSGSNLSEIRVVPNPYNIKARTIQFGQEAPDRLAFYGLPDNCVIKIYTVRGNLIKTIYHNDGSGDELWDSRTESGQLIVSGMYIAYFEVMEDVIDEQGSIKFKKGEKTFQKFIVIR
ncbi:hypothetical protein DRQ07_04480 [candidate division KSB1 bacterium]|nr:MAG: hypothetical protein DRQ07_04480 [candidate division KSB1 bacterium]